MVDIIFCARFSVGLHYNEFSVRIIRRRQATPFEHASERENAVLSERQQSESNQQQVSYSDYY